MNLIEAIKSGKPYRHPTQAINWIQPNELGRLFYFAQVTAEGWQIQEPTVTITRSQFYEAVREAYAVEGAFVPDLARKLGLE